ncbi:MAG: orotate phosphoribosyltransferase [Dehalococcoidia bacterium]|nr:orotate phosphoribosyltransferase [Dehalococcoidia bacterium]
MSDEILEIFRESGAILEGHFLLTSGMHSPVYWEKFKVLQYPHYTQRLCGLIAGNFKNAGVRVVAGPTTGGVILAFETARQLGVRGIFAEKTDGGRAFRRGFSISPGEKVLIVDDILTTGGSVREVIEAVKKLGGDIVGVGVLVDRSDVGIDFGIPLFACLRSPTVAYPPEKCPLCAEGRPLVRLGG